MVGCHTLPPKLPLAAVVLCMWTLQFLDFNCKQLPKRVQLEVQWLESFTSLLDLLQQIIAAAQRHSPVSVPKLTVITCLLAPGCPAVCWH